MVLYRGVEIDAELATSIRHMDQVEEYREALQVLQGVWDNLALLGHLSGTRIEIGEVRSAFAGLTTRLLNSLGRELRRKAVLDLQAKAQVAIDILVRNLFERTADIGFLATDTDLRGFAEAQDEERAARRPALLERFREYQRNYSVYANIILLSPAGEVLAQLDERSDLARSHDPLIEACLTTSAAYVESYRQSDLQPGADKALIYSYRVSSTDGRRNVGVLCLVFSFADECQRIFTGLIKSSDWCVITLIDREGAVIATSDEHQAPLGARITNSVETKTQVMRFGGRPFLSTICRSNGYQGYMGPGWSGQAMLPLEFAFSADEGLAQEIAPQQRARIMASETLFSDALREIPRSAGRIQVELNRAVWNGNVALAENAGANSGFSKTLLREIGRTGMRTRDLFSQAIENTNHAVVSSLLLDCRAKAALAIDIMDRNLYERANDCRWWALTTAFRSALAKPPVEPAAQQQITQILETINGLYTVYTNLLVFDAAGRIVATSNPAYRDRIGEMLEPSWVRQTLSLASSESYRVSAFEPSELYGDRHTYVYCASIRALEGRARVRGGIAIVFDAEPQFRAMLNESLPRAEDGTIKPGAFGVFLDRERRVIASSRPDYAVGSELDFGEPLPKEAGESWQKVLTYEGTLYAVGACRSSGYREFKSPSDPYRNDVSTLVFVPLAAASAQGQHELKAAAGLRLAHKPPPFGAQESTIDLASFAIAGQWYAVPSSEVVEARRLEGIASLPGAPAHIRGCARVRDEVLAVLDLPFLLGGVSARVASDTQHIVIIRATDRHPGFGLLVDELGDTPEVATSRIVPTPDVGRSPSLLIDKVVAPDANAPDESILILLSIERLSRYVDGLRSEPLSA